MTDARNVDFIRHLLALVRAHSNSLLGAVGLVSRTHHPLLAAGPVDADQGLPLTHLELATYHTVRAALSADAILITDTELALIAIQRTSDSEASEE